MARSIRHQVNKLTEEERLRTRTLRREANLQQELLAEEGIETPRIGGMSDARLAKWHARGSSSQVVKKGQLKAKSGDPLKGNTIVSLPQSKNSFSNFSFNHLLGFLLGRRVSLLAPDSTETEQRSHFIEGIVAGLSNTFLQDLSKPEISSLKIRQGDDYDALKKYFAPLRKAADSQKASWVANSIVSSALEKLNTFNPAKLARAVNNNNISKPIVGYLTNFWNSLIQRSESAREPQNALLAAI